MADNYLITGYWGEPHVTAENDRGINAAMFGTGRFVLPVGEQFRAEYIGNNTIRMYDGKLMDNGAAAGIPAGEYVDLLIANAGQGKKRNDLIVFQYEQDASTLIESGKFVVIQGTETSGTAADPELTQEDLLSGRATFDQMALWRVSVSGANIAAPVRVTEVEWANPPMVAGVEYRTTKRHDGKPVYTKLVNYGKLSTSSVSIGTKNVISMSGVSTFIDGSGTVYHDTFPIHNSNGFDVLAMAFTGNGSLFVKTNAGFPATQNYTAEFTIEYVKD